MGYVETEKEHPDPISIEPDDLARFLVAKGAKIDCYVCGTHQWTNMEDSENFGFHISTQDPNGSTGSKVFPMMLLLCNNCGNLWSMARRPVEIWIKENPRGE